MQKLVTVGDLQGMQDFITGQSSTRRSLPGEMILPISPFSELMGANPEEMAIFNEMAKKPKYREMSTEDLLRLIRK